MDEQVGSNIVDFGVDLSEFYMSVEWDILEVPAVRYVIQFDFPIVVICQCASACVVQAKFYHILMGKFVKYKRATPSMRTFKCSNSSKTLLGFMLCDFIIKNF